MEATILKSIRVRSHKDHKPVVVKEVSPSNDAVTSDDGCVKQQIETSDSLGSLTYVSSKGFFFH